MKPYPKRIKRQLNELVGQAYENELARELDKLAQHFDDWREGQIDAFELTELIHQYHNGPARELWKRYVGNPHIELLMVRAIVEGILKQENVSEEVWPYVEEAMERYRFMWDDV